MTTAEGDIDGVETKTRFITEASVTGTGNNTFSNYMDWSRWRCIRTEYRDETGRQPINR
jgi:hypothetical protein